MDMRLLLLLVLVGPGISQKLFFKSNRVLEDAEKASMNTSAVTCPGGQSACPDGNTCCMLITRAYGCCSLPMASCCLDGKHCCPKGTKCDLVLKACINGDMVVPWNENQAVTQDLTVQKDNSVDTSASVDVQVGSVLCQDGAHECETGQSCCPSADGFACCSFPDAVCCSDKIHCCPKGTKCDVTHLRCVQQNGDIISTWLDRSPSTQMKQVQDVNMNLKAVQCDASHECPTGNTCCKLATGAWGCCPKPNAVCCADKIHCCPHDTTCHTGTGQCKSGDLLTDWLEKVPAIKTSGSVQCDETQECMTGTTCCKTTGGEWGCCPLPDATCCDDHIHCCPSGYTCDVTAGKCSQGTEQIDWVRKESTLKLRNVQCDGAYECPDGNTCCKLASGQWGCCPIPNAVCCSDQVHCCPSGYTCDVGSGKCNKGDLQINWIQKQPVMKVKNVQCDGTYECPTGNTCCKLATGQWGCCPIPDAVCCSDQVHCCPSGYTCDVGSGKCNKGGLQIDWIEKQSVMKVENVQCDGSHYCPTGNTCCKLASGQWGCCPIPDAVCCSDQVHCCPSGYTCDVGSGKCNKGDLQIDWIQKQPVMKVNNVQCDGTSECPTGNTCCKLATGQWGCCPIPDAVCCSDQVHCCPSGYTCDVGSGKCNKGGLQIDWIEKQSVMKVENVQCDGSHYCPTGNTCCKLATGQWGCCPIPDAVCCSDQVHCCPSGYTCDVGSGKCNKGDLQIDWIQKQPVIKVENVQCDGTYECPTGNTCCKLATGQWGCCPIPDAVCCSDQVHCCPSGYTCDVGSGKCNKGDLQIDWIQKHPVMKVENVQCDGSHYCPNGNTCCKLATGQWGCCPIPDAVCCSDQVHCCPSGYTCDVGSGKCNKGDLQIDWIQKHPVLKVENVQCDGSHYCPTGNTCCKLATGQWGCCPIPDAVCCSDQVHCCPSGYTCDVGSGKCNKGGLQIDWIQKQPVMKVENVQCDGSHYCPNGNTCCKLATGQWGCCPIPDAVCCSDQVHCCPSGYTCDVGSGKCNKGDLQIDWIQKHPVMKVENVQCDGSHYCPNGNTCCKLATGQWGCCPIPDAVCCSDQVHCCPSGYTCDVGSGKCNKGDLQIDWIQKHPVLKVEKVQCDGSHYCPTGNTCCKLATGQWGCCPIPDAVCCSDQVHCCPSGYTCDVGSGKCNKGDLQIDWIQKQPVMKVNNVQCDGTYECPTGNTCCKLATGQWGCCPIPDAVCCSDNVHCCPSGYTCDVGSGKCNRGDLQIDWIQKQPVVRVENVQCDGSHYCPNGNTCCKLASGQWGCCPIPDAVCCSDNVHCCPSGYTCDVGSGKCNRGDLQIDWIQKQPVVRVENVQCDGSHYCPNGNTCCKLASGQWGCCPIPDAVCCSDNVHCCPSGYTCDVGSGKCNRGDLQIDWIQKQPVVRVENVQCDGSHYCPNGNTCCKLASGQWGCCPIPDAVCCSDQVHCCPSGYTCDVGSGKCNRGDLQIDWIQKQPVVRVENVQCDGSHYCPNGNTCCKLASGQWGCCPIPDAVCCNDKVHCCPSGTTCDVSSGKCTRGRLQIDWFRKEPAVKGGSVKCDAEYDCPDGKTCCKLSTGAWGCCPLPNAVCCDDHSHCCPHGTTCDITTGQCQQAGIQLDWAEMGASLVSEVMVASVICPDGSECQDGQTCCRMSKSEAGTYGCCPTPNAVCCSDGEHCCPHGYKCDVHHGTCVRGIIKTSWYKTISSVHKDMRNSLQEGQHTETAVDQSAIREELISAADVTVKDKTVPCAGTAEGCLDGMTCCANNEFKYKCCPYHEGVCCPDKMTCCPKGYICDEEPGICRIPESSRSAAQFLKELFAKQQVSNWYLYERRELFQK